MGRQSGSYLSTSFTSSSPYWERRYESGSRPIVISKGDGFATRRDAAPTRYASGSAPGFVFLSIGSAAPTVSTCDVPADFCFCIYICLCRWWLWVNQRLCCLRHWINWCTCACLLVNWISLSIMKVCALYLPLSITPPVLIRLDKLEDQRLDQWLKLLLLQRFSCALTSKGAKAGSTRLAHTGSLSRSLATIPAVVCMVLSFNSSWNQ